MSLSWADIDAFVLCGGRGTRVRHLLGGEPKALALVRGRPVIDHVLEWLWESGVKNVVLGLGFNYLPIIDHCEKQHRRRLVFSIEYEEMGTAGAVRYARRALLTDPVLVVNGDTIIDADMVEFLRVFERVRKPVLLVDRQRVSAGACLLPRNVLDRLNTSSETSFEHFLESESLVRLGCESFIDVGTPEGLQRARA